MEDLPPSAAGLADAAGLLGGSAARGLEGGLRVGAGGQRRGDVGAAEAEVATSGAGVEHPRVAERAAAAVAAEEDEVPVLDVRDAVAVARARRAAGAGRPAAHTACGDTAQQGEPPPHVRPAEVSRLRYPSRLIRRVIGVRVHIPRVHVHKPPTPAILKRGAERGSSWRRAADGATVYMPGEG